uniref:Replication protein B (RepB) n=1 Tax=Ochrobactrum sp. LM19 TaxID=1449781 RepID=A0A0D5A080_9HYPH|nr:plasmid partitioning protein RepB [Ochrobactrum sp. LM19]AJW29947.1 replication protein B (RepB) [Ochrobactrum sp. LM19]
MKGKDILKGMIDAGKPTEQGVISTPIQRPAGAIKALNLGLNRLSEEAAEARQLREALSKAENVLDVDTSVIDASIVADRLSAANDRAFLELKSAIAVSGQQVPVLLRVHPDNSDRYQAAYGHRRIRAASELGIPVKAIVRQLSDEQMVVAQGQENGSRVDLSFIERAMFASRLEYKGFSRDTICAALGVDKPELSRLLTVAGAIDDSIIIAIGPAPKVGRPRWLQFAQSLTNRKALTKVRVVLEAPAFKEAESDTRFRLAYEAASTLPSLEVNEPKQFKLGNTAIVMVEKKGKRSQLTIFDSDFSTFIEDKMDQLISEYDTMQKGKIVR